MDIESDAETPHSRTSRKFGERCGRSMGFGCLEFGLRSRRARSDAPYQYGRSVVLEFGFDLLQKEREIARLDGAR